MEVWIARFIGPATRERNDNHSKNQMQWCGIARAPRRSPDAGLTDDGLLLEVRAASSRRFGRAAESRRPAARDACYVCAKCTGRRPPKAVALPRALQSFAKFAASRASIKRREYLKADSFTTSDYGAFMLSVTSATASSRART